MPDNASKKPLIQVLERAFDILEMLARGNAPMRATDIAAELGLSIQTVGNLLRTLYERGYLSQDAKRFYRLGGQCFYLGSYADRWKDLRKAADRVIPELRRETGLLVFIGVIESDKLFCITLDNGNEPGPPSQRWADELHSTACGRLLLAGLSAEDRKKLLPGPSGKRPGGPSPIPIDSNRSAAPFRNRDSQRCTENPSNGSAPSPYRSGTAKVRSSPPSPSPAETPTGRKPPGKKNSNS